MDRNKLNYRIGPLRSDSVIELVSDLITELDQAVWAVLAAIAGFYKRFGLLLHNFRAKVPMKLSAPDDFLSK